MKKTILLLLLLVCATAINARTRKVLFIGNSYIYSNNIPELLKQLALSKGDTLVYDQNVPGAYTFQQHSTDATTLNKIKSQQWDIVILQEQSQRPAFNPSQVASDTYPYARKLDSLVRANNPCTETMFYMTWGRKNGDASNCGFYPPICTYAGMQQRLRESYMQMTDDNNAVVTPVGVAWKVVRDSLPAIDLYISDESHPSQHGSYLVACVFYASIFHKTPMGSSYLGNLPAADAQKLQYYASKVTMDSLAQWQTHGNYTTAAYSYTAAANKLTFQNKSAFATSYSWNFGDGNTSTQASPVHTYTQPGKYKVTFTASNSCFSETITDSLATEGYNNIANLTSSKDVIRIATMNNGSVTAQILKDGYKELVVYSMSGSKVKTYNISGVRSVIISDLVPGMYVYSLLGSEVNITGQFNIQ